MRFVLIDRILSVQRGESLVAVKNLSLAEEYLSDHFPGFPVMPGVLMLEALTQAGAWLIRDMEDFAHSIIVLKQAKTIKYGSFVEPGRQLELRVEPDRPRRAGDDVQGRRDDRRPGDGQGTDRPDTLTTCAIVIRHCTDRRVDRRRACATCIRRSERGPSVRGRSRGCRWSRRSRRRRDVREPRRSRARSPLRRPYVALNSRLIAAILARHPADPESTRDWP